MPDHGRSSAVGFAINGKGYVALGRYSKNNIQLNDCWEYDPATDLWSEKAQFPGKPRVNAAAAVLNGKAYVGLGFDLNVGAYHPVANLKDFYMYDPGTDTWTRKADFPSNATVACVSLTYNNEIYYGAGFNDHNFSNEFWKYNPEKDEWFQLNDFIGDGRAGALVSGDSAHIFFGTGYRTSDEDDWWEFFPQNDSWKKRKSPPDNGRENGVAFAVKHRYFIGTGRHFGGPLTGGNLKSDILEYDAVRNIWYKRGNIPAGNRENAVTFTINDKVYIGFGENDSTVLNDLWSFNPAN